MAKTLVTELCPHCDRENTIEWDVDKEGLQAFCPGCGKRLMLCSMCEDLGNCASCSWNEKTQSCDHSKTEDSDGESN